ncbi:MAG: CHAD domain-containing protein [Acidobacteriota bacterium]
MAKAKKAIKWDEEASAAVNARRKLPPLVEGYFAEGRALVNGNPPPEALHQFRLHSKRLRYTLELFRPVYGPGLEQRLDGVREIQQYLGDLNDCAATERLITAALPARAAERKKMEAFLRVRAQQKTTDFRRYWRTAFDAAGREQLWTSYLKRVARG